MSLPEKYDRRLKQSLGLRAVWLPGTEIGLGDILQHRDGVFQPIGNLSDFGVKFKEKVLGKRVSLSFQAKGVKWTLIQAGAHVDPAHVSAGATAEIKIEFKSKDTYFIRTPKLTGVGISNLISVGRSIKAKRDWRHRDYFVAWQVYRATEFAFLGSQGKKGMVRFSGDGKAIREFVNVGVGVNVTRVAASGVIIDIVGKGGPIGMRVRRIKKNGQLW